MQSQHTANVLMKLTTALGKTRSIVALLLPQKMFAQKLLVSSFSSRGLINYPHTKHSFSLANGAKDTSCLQRKPSWQKVTGSKPDSFISFKAIAENQGKKVDSNPHKTIYSVPTLRRKCTLKKKKARLRGLAPFVWEGLAKKEIKGFRAPGHYSAACGFLWAQTDPTG